MQTKCKPNADRMQAAEQGGTPLGAATGAIGSAGYSIL